MNYFKSNGLLGSVVLQLWAWSGPEAGENFVTDALSNHLPVVAPGSRD